MKVLCDFCRKPMRGQSEPGDICGKCTEKADRELSEEISIAAKKAMQRHCRGCSRPLTPGRYFNCRECLPPGEAYYPHVHW